VGSSLSGAADELSNCLVRSLPSCPFHVAPDTTARAFMSLRRGRASARSGFSGSIRLDELDRADAERLGEFVEGDDGRVAPALLQSAEILLAETRPLGHLLLGEAFLASDPGEVAAHQPAHVHAL